MTEPTLRFQVQRRATKLPPEYGTPTWEITASFNEREDAADAALGYSEGCELYEYRMVDTLAAHYGDAMAKSAANATDDFLHHLLSYAGRAVVADSLAADIAKAEMAAVTAEFERRGLLRPSWA